LQDAGFSQAVVPSALFHNYSYRARQAASPTRRWHFARLRFSRATQLVPLAIPRKRGVLKIKSSLYKE